MGAGAGQEAGVRPDRLSARFREWRAGGRTALIPYITAGYPNPQSTAGLLRALADAGADIIELGVPFSDPIADGPTIQRSSQRAIENGVTLEWCLETARAFRARNDTALVLFTYLNPVLRHGLDRFIDDANAAGIDGVLLTDLPAGGDVELEESVERSGLALIRLIAPTTTRERALAIARNARGFLYYIARMGVTGASATLRSALADELTALRSVSDAPIAVGFGISTPAQVAEVARSADGVVVGSALIDALDSAGIEGAAALVRGLRTGLDAPKTSSTTSSGR